MTVEEYLADGQKYYENRVRNLEIRCHGIEADLEKVENELREARLTADSFKRFNQNLDAKVELTEERA